MDAGDRYSRQVIFPPIGEEGQRRLSDSFVAVIGCGGLGTMIASTLVRAGIGRTRIIDRDRIECHNLQRQVLFSEEDIHNGLPKAVAAERFLRKVNSSVEVEGIVADVDRASIEGLVAGADVIMDGMDNFEGRFLVNDVSLKHGIPWVYGSAVGSCGMTMSIIPGKTPCFRCLTGSQPPPGMPGTCDTAGIVGAAPSVIGALQSAQAIRILIGEDVSPQYLTLVDVWLGDFRRLRTGYRKDCPGCQGRYDYLEGRR